MQRAILILAALALILGGVGQAKAGITVYTSDFIADATRTAYNGFESIPNNGAYYTDPPGVASYGPYTEGGITVQQMTPQNNQGRGQAGIFVTAFHPEGDYGWYTYDWGYTKITMSDGSEFPDVGFDFGSGFTRVAPTYVYYNLLKQNQTVSSGYVDFLSDPGNTGGLSNSGYLGFSGGEFDEIWVRDLATPTHFDWTLWKYVLDVAPDPFGAGLQYENALAIDAIEVAPGVPEPSTLTILWSLLGSLGIAFGWRRWRRVA